MGHHPSTKLETSILEKYLPNPPLIPLETEGLKSVEYWRNIEIEIDNELVEIIRACWKYGIRTDGCCQGDGNPDPGFEDGFIRFHDYESCASFLSRIGSGIPSGKWRMFSVSDGRGHFRFGFVFNFLHQEIPLLRKLLLGDPAD